MLHLSRQFIYIIGILFFFFSPLQVSAQSSLPPAQLWEINMVFQTIIYVVLGTVGLASFVMIIIGGFKYLTAGADKDATNKARLTLSYAIVGLITAASAWLILQLIGTFLGVDFKYFDICIDPAGC
jgi:ABC-type antimicrobial peptide transport system permease subunit